MRGITLCLRVHKLSLLTLYMTLNNHRNDHQQLIVLNVCHGSFVKRQIPFFTRLYLCTLHTIYTLLYIWGEMYFLVHYIYQTATVTTQKMILLTKTHDKPVWCICMCKSCNSRDKISSIWLSNNNKMLGKCECIVWIYMSNVWKGSCCIILLVLKVSH